ncbi:hypothetical protein [Mycolicibacterium fortuitum]|uniref:Trypsin-like peptidase domain-containing protein n=1 Tax=Mycolicibacterium fortuitum subsp. fortuitum DSM 46621 = ATCC 6841 = JCM 6387 TaxID=1214102 RepID=K0VLE7_MYCFO|nr:hypothetical protein [Mycolicibacterium fortuitum]EJZ15793.1 hypothetical protein MFORT_02749 [Mycolicibacterium fortuitum subsp. fortuitum DSM 46621 = ATCC 6841 = JCM 6387]WEV33459.1 hypothetical protein OMF10_03310 [Mycolicibacterium fortuitum]CRL54779.1 hypothetical protein CPGR_02076 [Mycolicibacterium fortuitum subsp. fortuitum DSM 46621 = ATCC 6841 = JCM 6387]CRL79606.1 hypothetical protein CPGR_02801 [Mycolicibacter nonchromogenicus]
MSPLILKCVCFVCIYADGDYRPVGTAFFLGVTPEGYGPSDQWCAVVTALHVIAGIEKSGGQIFLRVNTKSGGVDYVEMPPERWVRPDHSGGIVDAAACFFSTESQEKTDFKFIGEKQAITAEGLRDLHVGVGNDVYLSGLFVNHAGTQRNEPIIRSGTFAAIPEEEVLTNHGRMRAYLIESRSIGGLSGSPVFVEPGLTYFTDDGQIHMRPPLTRAWHLLGIIQGHWDVPELFGPDTSLSAEAVNKGIAIVTPIDYALRLAHEAVLQAFAAWDAEHG